MCLYLSVGAECQDTRTQEPSLDTSTTSQCVDLGTPICNVIGIDGSVTNSTFDASGDASTPSSGNRISRTSWSNRYTSDWGLRSKMAKSRDRVLL
jgi:hypothetical protein